MRVWKACGADPRYALSFTKATAALLIRRFPYAVFYELSEATVTIYAVFHTSRDPSKWRQRLP